MLRVVFDTNILISALVFPGGRAEAALARIINGRDILFFSKPILDELLTVLARKFARDEEQLAHTAVFISEIAQLCHPRRRLHILTDEPDNRILECALAAHAEMIVTGDQAMLRLGAYQTVKIITLRQYLDL